MISEGMDILGRIQLNPILTQKIPAAGSPNLRSVGCNSFIEWIPNMSAHGKQFPSLLLQPIFPDFTSLLSLSVCLKGATLSPKAAAGAMLCSLYIVTSDQGAPLHPTTFSLHWIDFFSPGLRLSLMCKALSPSLSLQPRCPTEIHVLL